MAKLRLVAIVSGRVHGVGFRDFTERQATRLGLVGEVRNIPNGTVEVIAEGEPAELDALLAELRQGPRGASVTGVVFSWSAPSGDYDDFRIGF